MRCGASFLFWQEQGQFCLDKPLDEYQSVSHEKPLIFNPALYLTKPWKWIVNERRAKASLLSLQITESANSCWIEPGELQVFLELPVKLCTWAVHLHLHYWGIARRAWKSLSTFLVSTKCMPLSPSLYLYIPVSMRFSYLQLWNLFFKSSVFKKIISKCYKENKKYGRSPPSQNKNKTTNIQANQNPLLIW